uniref:claudin-7-like n=1 Tax=Myxine glutinosa TaxID=7769 RepID=UPI00358F164D
MGSTPCQVLACILCFVALLGFTISTAYPVWKIASKGPSVVGAIMYQGLWLKCVGNSMGSQVCRLHNTIFRMPVYIQVAQAMMIISMLLSLLGILIVLMGMKCSRISGNDERIKGRIVAIGGILNIFAGIAVLTVVSFYARQLVYEFYNPIPGTKYEFGISLYIGWGSSVLALVGGVMLTTSFTCCNLSTPKIPRAGYSAATKNPARSSMRSYSRNAYV